MYENASNTLTMTGKVFMYIKFSGLLSLSLLQGLFFARQGCCHKQIDKHTVTKHEHAKKSNIN